MVKKKSKRLVDDNPLVATDWATFMQKCDYRFNDKKKGELCGYAGITEMKILTSCNAYDCPKIKYIVEIEKPKERPDYCV
jgi:hypothetical protein